MVVYTNSITDDLYYMTIHLKMNLRLNFILTILVMALPLEILAEYLLTITGYGRKALCRLNEISQMLLFSMTARVF